MIASIKNSIKKLGEKYPEWERLVSEYYADQEVEDIDEGLMSEFNTIIVAICETIKKGICSIDDGIDLFENDLKLQIKEDLERRLRPYYGCAIIRKNEKKNKTQLEFLIDELWQQSIIRRNPEHQINLERTEILTLSNEEVEKFTITLSAIVDHCISRLLNYDAMVSVIYDQTGISREFSEYIARKIEKDNESLRTNYIIKSLLRLSNAI